jgi:enediyne biosynthesis protein E4
MDMFDGVGRRRDRNGLMVDIGQHSLNGYERNVLFRNEGGGRFTDVAWVNGADRVEDGRGLAVFDYDRDGRLDLLLRNYRQPAELLHNQAPARHWIELALIGTRSNRDAVGAVVRVRSAAGTQTRVVSAGSGYLSASSKVQHVGLGDATRADDVTVAWPSGATSALGPLAADRRWTVVEGTAGAW